MTQQSHYWQEWHDLAHSLCSCGRSRETNGRGVKACRECEPGVGYIFPRASDAEEQAETFARVRAAVRNQVLEAAHWENVSAHERAVCSAVFQEQVREIRSIVFWGWLREAAQAARAKRAP